MRTVLWMLLVVVATQPTVTAQSPVGVSTPVPASGLVFHAPLDGGASDVVGNMPAAVVGAQLVPDRDGNPNSAYEFVGPNLTHISYSGSFPNGYVKSLCLWMKPSTPITRASFGGGILDGNPTPPYTRIPLGWMTDYWDDEILALWTNEVSADAYYWKGGVIPIIDTNWHHLAIVRDSASGSYRIYLDGIDKGLGTVFGSPTEMEFTNPVFGRDADGSAQEYFSGRLDDIRMYNRALSAAEIQELAGGGATVGLLFESDGSSMAPFTCNYVVSNQAVVNQGDGNPAPSIEFDTGAGFSKEFAIYTLPQLAAGQTFHGSIDFEMGQLSGDVMLVFGLSFGPTCDYNPWAGPGTGRYPIPTIGYSTGSGAIYTDFRDVTGNIVRKETPYAIGAGTWHTADLTMAPSPQNGYDFTLRIDSQVVVEGRSYEQIGVNERLGFGIGADSSMVTKVKYDNLKAEIISSQVVPLAAAFIWAPQNLLAGQAVQFTDTSTGSPTSWVWTFGGGGASNAQHPVHVFAVPGSYTVTLTASNTAGSSSQSHVVEVPNRPPAAVDGSFTTASYHAVAGVLQASDPDGQAVTFAVASAPSRGTVTVTDVATGAFTYQPNPGIAGSDSFTFTASDGQLVSSPATVVITINAENPDVVVRLLDSAGDGLAGGSVSYYQAGWKALGVTGADGSATKELAAGSYPFRVEYQGGVVGLSQDIGTNPVVVFQTREVVVQLKDSTGSPLDPGTVEYYANGWRPFGTTSGGEVLKQLLPTSYPFAMSYLGGRVQLSQDIGTNPVVVFQTREVVVQLKDSTGNPLDPGTVEYYANGWRSFGTTSGGEVHKQLLPASYPFAMSYLGGRVQLSQDIGANPVVVFQTREVVVQLKDSTGNPLDPGTVEYYANGWRSFGTTSGGEVHKQLLPASYPFAMSYSGARVQKTQDIGSDVLVGFQTGAVVSDSSTCTSYYASGWRPFVQGMQLLPGSYSFRFSSGSPTPELFTVAAGTETHIR